MVRIAAELGMTPSSRTASGSARRRPRIRSRRSAGPWLGHPGRPGHRLRAAVAEGRILTNRLVRLACASSRGSDQRRRARPALRSRRRRATRSTSSASCVTPRASGPGRPSRSRPGRRSWSAACSAGSARMVSGASAPPIARCRGRTARARCRPASASTCWSPTASRGRDLLRRDHPRSGADRVRRGQAHGRLAPRSSAGSAS